MAVSGLMGAAVPLILKALRQDPALGSGVIVDRCGDHGTWLDADEIEQIAGFVLSGGRPRASAAMAAAEAHSERVSREARRGPAPSVAMQTPLLTQRESNASGGAAMLARFLWELLD